MGSSTGWRKRFARANWTRKQFGDVGCL